MTPEGRVKAKVKKIIDAYKPRVYAHWPVQNGMGSPTLDCIGCAGGQYFGVECKAPGEKPTERQAKTMDEIVEAGGTAFVIDGNEEQLDYFDRWLHTNVMGGIAHQHRAKGYR